MRAGWLAGGLAGGRNKLDARYPGMDFEVKDKENFVVKFMTTTRKLGQYKWPLREDIQTVQKQFLISAGFVPDYTYSVKYRGTYRDTVLPYHDIPRRHINLAEI
ncbi:hypothetical protein DPMN_018968 [Dreissena polymorpha]|uniref:Uncharacterized protein n=1 Tax=Dreissena polymorpha TaxID=45954 RepID=A0A9D4S6V3_DREPO|nr:hypothetical protein DPMN_018968 [Dreissena polymorpha]